MKIIRHISAATTVIFLFAIAAGQVQQVVPLAVGTASIAEWKGDVVLHSPAGTTVDAKRGLVLEPESVIDTGKGSILPDLQDGSQVLVKPKSRVVLKSPNIDKKYFLELLLGKVVATIRKRLSDTPSFRMGTPTAVITVRGTRFEVDVTKEKRTYVEVYEGVVEVAGLRLGSRPILLQPGFSTRVESNRDPDQPRSWRDAWPGGDDDRIGSRRGERDSEDQQNRSGSDANRPDSERDREPHD